MNTSNKKANTKPELKLIEIVFDRLEKLQASCSSTVEVLVACICGCEFS